MAAVATQWASEAPKTSSRHAAAEARSHHHHSHQQSSPAPRPDYDRFYGHRDLAELCEQVISLLFACPLDSTAASVACGSSSTRSGGRQAPRLAEFIAYALHRTRLPLAVTHQALFLLKRLKARFPAARGSSGHRLFISALMLASKSSCDDTYSNKSWTIVGQGLFSLREVNQMERELFGYLGFKVNVANEHLCHFVELLDAGLLEDAITTASPSSKSTTATVATSPSPISSPTQETAPMTAAIPQIQAPCPPSPPSPAQSQRRHRVESASAANSPSSSSVVGPHRMSFHRARHLSAAGAVSTFNSRASISGYPSHPSHFSSMSMSAQHHHAPVYASSERDGSSNSNSSTSMARSASVQHERTSSAFAFQHYAMGIRERSRPYDTMPTHSVALNNGAASTSNGASASASHLSAAAAAAAGPSTATVYPHFYMSPSGSSSCSSLRQSISSGSSFSASPSPSLIGGHGSSSCGSSIGRSSASSVSSGRTTPDPDTPPSDYAEEHDGAGAGAIASAGVSPMCTDVDDSVWGQQAHQQQQQQAQQQQYYSAMQHQQQRYQARQQYDAMHGGNKLNPTAAALAHYAPQWSA